MPNKKRTTVNLASIILCLFVIAGLVLSVTGMFIDVVTVTASINVPIVGSILSTANYGIFDEALKESGINTAFLIISFIAVILSLLVLAFGQIAKLLGKNINFVSIIGSAMAFIGVVLVVIASFVLANDIKSTLSSPGIIIKDTISAFPAVGVLLSAIGGIVGGVSGFLSVTRIAR